MENVLVTGHGNRELSLCWKLAQCPEVKTIYCSPGTSGFSSVPKVETVSLDLKNFKSLSEWAVKQKISLVVIGPEDHLSAGMIDALEAAGLVCFGPKTSAAKIETDKSFAKDFMTRHGIPTAKYSTFTDPVKAKNFIRTADYEALVVKASGLAAGKGVIVAKDKDEACAAVDTILVDKKFGDSGSTVVIEELLEGEEISVLAFTDGSTVRVMLPAQDHKRIFDGDLGPNTGGMGAYAPCPLVDAGDFRWIEKHVIQKAVDGLREENNPFMGVLFAGLMLTRTGPKVLEYNCRFGDPETEVILPLLENNLFQVMMACCKGTLSSIQLNWKKNTWAVGVTVTSQGYPESSSNGDLIPEMETVKKLPGVTVFQAGTAKKGDQWVTAGGRCFICVSLSHSLVSAAAKATNACRMAGAVNAHYRRDIAHKGIPKWILLHGQNSYKASGVDIKAGDDLVNSIKPAVGGTTRPGVMSGLGGFGAFFDPMKAGFKNPVLVSGADGVGTKVKVAQACGMHSTIGIDLVAMCVNDILCHGAEPLFFLDYFACGRLEVGVASQVIAGVAQGCQMSGCSLVGGETAEMPGLYKDGDYDLAGFAVGAVEKGSQLPFIERLQAGDVVIALPSSGLHSNGFSLVRKIIEMEGLEFTDPCPFSDKTIGEELLTPTRIYVQELLPHVKAGNIKAIAHITGGGLTENIPRILSDQLRVTLDARKWAIPRIFSWLCTVGQVSETEMLRTFNCGVGIVMIVSRSRRDSVLKTLKGSSLIGEVQLRNQGETQVNIKNFTEAISQAMSVHIPSLIQKAETTKRIAVLISGTGTNLQAVIDDIKRGNIDGEIVTVVSNKAGVLGLSRAEQAGIPTKVIPHENFKTREAFEAEIHNHLVNCQTELVVLAGFMRILTHWFVSRWRGALINIHPALLPSFKGVNAWQQALDAGVRVSGCTVHFVDVEVDGGAIIAQEVVPVDVGETVESLQMKIRKAELQALPNAVKLLCSGKCRLELETNKVLWI